MLVLEVSVSEPFTLYRTTVSLVLGGIWLFTLIEAISFIVAMTRRTKGEDETEAALAHMVQEAHDAAESAAPAASNSALRTRVEQAYRALKFEMDVEQLRRIARKAMLLKALEFASLSTLRRHGRELLYITLLLVLNVACIWYFYSL